MKWSFLYVATLPSISMRTLSAHRLNGPTDLASALGRTIWIPEPWPSELFGDPGFYLVEDGTAYYVAGSPDETDEDVESLVVHGFVGGLHPRPGLNGWRSFEPRPGESVLVKSEDERGMVFLAREGLGIRVMGLGLTLVRALEVADLLRSVDPRGET
jgi:hypothetical protein